MTTKCFDIMTVDPEACEQSCTAEKIAQLMKTKNIGSVPIIDSRDSFKLVGIVTDRDLVLKVMAESGNACELKAGDIMTPQPVSCKSDDDVNSAIKSMEEFQVRRIPVTNESGKLVGIIAQADIALRLGKSHKIEEVVTEISKPSTASTPSA